MKVTLSDGELNKSEIVHTSLTFSLCRFIHVAWGWKACSGQFERFLYSLWQSRTPTHALLQNLGVLNSKLCLMRQFLTATATRGIRISNICSETESLGTEHSVRVWWAATIWPKKMHGYHCLNKKDPRARSLMRAGCLTRPWAELLMI